MSRNQVLPRSSELSRYSDASSSYWPPGWNFDKFAHATNEESDALPDDERDKMQAGLRNVLGEDGINEMARVVWQEQLRIMELNKAEPASDPPPPIPDWLKTWSQYYQGQPWGFVVFSTVAVNSLAALPVKEFQNRVGEIVELPFDPALEQGWPTDLVAAARSTFELRWINVGDEGGEEDMERLRARFRAMQESTELPPGLSLPVFLCVSPEAMASVSSDKPATTGPRWRSGAPFLMAVAAEVEQSVIDEEDWERDCCKPTFNVAAEVLVDELWWVVERQVTSLANLTRFVREALGTDDAKVNDENDGLDDIWWSVHRPPHRMRERRRALGKWGDGS